MTNADFAALAQEARGANLAEYFRQSGYATHRHGSEVYVREYPGLCVNEKTGAWYCHYTNTGGNNAVNCLTQVCGHSFRQAVTELTGQDVKGKRDNAAIAENQKPDAEETRALRMPKRDENMRRVFAYLCKERGIPAETVSELAHAKLLYQSREEIQTTVKGIEQTAKRSNAVFVHRDAQGEAIGGEVQGVNSYKRYKGVVAGTGESVFAFTPNPAADGKPKAAYIFESAIDLMSYYAIHKGRHGGTFPQGVTLISMAGLKPAIPKKLQAQGVLVMSCVDNDKQGKAFEETNGFKRLNGADDPLKRAGVKDWNELLVKVARAENEKAREGESAPRAPAPERKKAFGRGRK